MSTESSLFNGAIATIFAREFLEGTIIINNYRTVIQKNEDWDEETRKKALKNVTYSATAASLVAILVVLAIGIPLGLLGQQLNEKAIEVIEGVSKVVASICIMQLSVKIPVWLGIYWKVSILPWKQNFHTHTSRPDAEKISFNEIRFNVAWNIWREVAECGVFLIPFFLGTGAKAIPLSALAGIAVALVLGGLMWIANHRIKSKVWLAVFMSGLTLFLAVGLFTGGCHEFEEVWGETPKVWTIANPFWSHKSFPMVMLKPFGYSSSRTVLQMVCFWVSLVTGLTFHYLKWRATKLAKAHYAEVDKNADVKELEVGNNEDEYPTKDVEAGGEDGSKDLEATDSEGQQEQALKADDDWEPEKP